MSNLRLLFSLTLVLGCHQYLSGKEEADERPRTILQNPETIPEIFPVVASDGREPDYLVSAMGLEGDWFKDGGPDNDHHRSLQSESWDVSRDHDESSISAFEENLAEFYNLIKSIPLEAARVQHANYPYLSTEERAEYEAKAKKKVLLYEKRYLDYRQQYKTWVDFIKPYRAELEVEKKRTASRRAKYKELILSYIKTANIPQSSILITSDYIYYFESVVFENGHLRINSHLVYYPASVGTTVVIHAFYDGRSLGHTVTEMEKGGPKEKQGVDLGCTHIIDVEDAGIPDSGTIEVIVESMGIHEKMVLSYDHSANRAVKTGTEIVLHCHRAGEHLTLPVKFQEDENQKSFECLVDTGASITTIARNPFPGSIRKEAQFTTANGIVSMPVAASHITVGEVQKELNVAFSGSGGVNLLGANFFSDFVYTIDLENNAIYLIKRGGL